ncbi:unnamed protein product [Cyprideis torosa]|uniref:Uncharacterized protein n=1 Tax=Cyprideis torosa TaxID=163714 RepID=A0A7R8WR83_9CRUS|nr:unnamed protein product [Cyprideis torosa]CAG0906773.1 unnamed protein product [Cyprideis torosa]
MSITTIVTDIEGTITDIAFVKDELFPYARARMATFVAQHAEEPAVAEQLQSVAKAIGCDADELDPIVSQLIQWIDEDKKAPALKTLQGMIWKAAYTSGELKGHLYPDVVPRLQAWKDQNLGLYVYSSGSVGAQKLLFGYSVAGDITGLFSGYFDTQMGQKQDAESYNAIAREIGEAPDNILFLSDHAGELEAAEQAGWQVAQLVRPAGTADERFPHYADLNEITAMTSLTIYPDTKADTPVFQSDNSDEILTKLAKLGIRFERWEAATPVTGDMTQEQVLAAYATQIQALKDSEGYVTADVVNMVPDHPDKDMFRAKFLEEHTHAEDEVRFFVSGSGQFNLHLNDQVVSIVCTKDDLIGVPAGTKHWFDMGPNPAFSAIRLFNNPDGWVARFTGDEIARSFPRYE